jgi:hypothetical protein
MRPYLDVSRVFDRLARVSGDESEESRLMRVASVVPGVVCVCKHEGSCEQLKEDEVEARDELHGLLSSTGSMCNIHTSHKRNEKHSN